MSCRRIVRNSDWESDFYGTIPDLSHLVHLSDVEESLVYQWHAVLGGMLTS